MNLYKIFVTNKVVLTTSYIFVEYADNLTNVWDFDTENDRKTARHGHCISGRILLFSLSVL